MSESSPSAGKKRRWPLILGGLLFLVIVAGLIAPSLIDVERFKPQIERVLQDTTGWDAELGEVELSLFRGKLGVSPASLIAPGNSGSTIEVERIDIEVGILALLRKELRIEAIRLVRPDIALVRPDVATGWIVPVASSDEGGDPTPASEPSGESETGPAGADTSTGQGSPDARGSDGFTVVIDEIGLKDGTLRLEDRVMTPPMVLELKAVTASFFPADGGLTGRFSLGNGGASWRGQFGKTLEVTLDDLETELLHPFVGPDLIHAGGRLSGKINLGFPLRIEGKLDADDLTLLSGVRPFDEAGLNFVVSPLGIGWQLEELEFHGDGARLIGGGPLSPALSLKLDMPETPLEGALRASESVLPLPIEVLAPGHVSATIRVNQPEGGDLTYEASGSLAAAELRPGELLPPAKDVQATFALDRRGRLEVQITGGTVAGGPVSGGAVIEQIVPPGKLVFSGALRDAVFGQLLGGIVRETAPVTGPTGFDAALGVDLASDALDARSLSGQVNFNARSLAMPGWNLDQAIRDTLKKKASSSGLLKDLLGKKDEEEKTAASDVVDKVEQLIDSLEGTLNFDRWPWGLENVKLGVGDVASTGSGSFDPEKGTIEFTLTSQLSREESDVLIARYAILRGLRDRSGRLTIPVSVSGSLLGPSIGVDVDEALKGNLLGDDVKKDDVKGLLRGLLKKD